MLERAAPRSELTVHVAPMLGTAAERMSSRLRELADEDGVTIAVKPRRSALLEKYLPESGGYMFYSLLSNAGVHPGAGRAQAFYGRPGKAVIDFDFKGLHHVRAYWLSVNIRLYLDLCDLVEPVLGWPEWQTLTGQIRARLEPLAQEAQQRYLDASKRTWPTRQPGPASRHRAITRLERTHDGRRNKVVSAAELHAHKSPETACGPGWYAVRSVFHGIRVVAVDIGSVRPSSKFAWAAFDVPGRDPIAVGTDPETAVSALAPGLLAGAQAALLLEAPMSVPVPDGQPGS